MGIGTVAYNFIKLIQSIDKNNIYKFYFDRYPSKIEKYIDKNDFEFCTIKDKFIWTNIYMSAKIISGNFDIFITFLDKGIPLILYKTKSICLICDLIPLLYTNFNFKSPLHRLYYKYAMNYTIKKADKILTISNSSKIDIVNSYAIDERKVCIITLGSNLPKVLSANNVLIKYDVSKKYILGFGSTEPRKNNIRLIKAFNLIRYEFKDVLLVIVGKLWENNTFDDFIINEQIILTGFVSDEDIPHFYKNAKLVVYPSLYEGFGLPVLDAMTCGVPVITSSVSSLPEVGGDAVRYVNPLSISEIAQAMREFLTDVEICDEYSNKGLVQSSHFKWEKMSEQVVDVCSNM